MNICTFSPNRTYRYSWRTSWNELPSIAFVMLNPSVADENHSDPTVSRCVKRAKAWNFGAVEVVNIFGLRSTNPIELYVANDPVGPGNDEAILNAVRSAKMVICGWGNHGKLCERSTHVLELLRRANRQFYALRINGNGEPGHPLYLPYNLTPIPYIP